MTEYKMSTGRGGAGNIRPSSSKAAPTYIKQGSHTPSILQPVYSTGRGGAGNMMKNYDAKLTRTAQDVDEDTISAMNDIDEQLDIRRGVEHIVSSRSRTHGNQGCPGDNADTANHDDDDDYISPIISSTENYVTNTISNVVSHISSGGKSAKSRGSSSDTPKHKHSHKHKHQKIRPQHKQQQQKMQPVVIGRGGAGNIVSPASSSASASKLKSKSRQDREPGAQQQKKGSFFSSLFSIFA